MAILLLALVVAISGGTKGPCVYEGGAQFWFAPLRSEESQVRSLLVQGAVRSWLMVVLQGVSGSRFLATTALGAPNKCIHV